MKKILTTLACGIAAIALVASAETPETALLKKRSAEFRKDVVRVADNVYTFTGHSVQPVSMIVGDDGLIIVDTGLDTESAQGVLTEMRKITDLPVKAIILTHGHGDHTGGLPVFAAEGSPDIWARDNLGDENNAFVSAGLTINKKRGARQGGFLLPPEKRINNGVAQAYYPKRGGAVFSKDESLRPTRLLNENAKPLRLRVSISTSFRSTAKPRTRSMSGMPTSASCFAATIFISHGPTSIRSAARLIAMCRRGPTASTKCCRKTRTSWCPATRGRSPTRRSSSKCSPTTATPSALYSIKPSKA